MQASKLIRLFQLLTPEEVKRLRSFLQSPFYTSNAHILNLYQLLRRHYPSFDAPQLTKEKVFEQLFPAHAYQHQKLLNLMSDFSALLSQYLQVLQLEQEPDIQEQLLIRAYAARPQGYKPLQKQLAKSHQRLDKLPFRDADYYRQKLLLHHVYVNHPETDPFQLSREQYDAAMQQLDQGFLLEKMLLSCEMKAREKPLSEQYEVWLLPEIRQRTSLDPAESPVTSAYLEMLNLLEQGEEETFFRLKALLWNQLPRLTRRQQQNILQSLINYTIQQGNQGHAHFLQENLSLYQFGLEEDLLTVHGILNDMTFLSIVNVALRAGESEWCLLFIETYGEALSEQVREEATTLAQALWYYARKRHKAAIELLREVEFVNVYYQIQTRVLLIKVFFESFQEDPEYLEWVLSQSESFERYLRRNKKLSQTQRTALLNFTASVMRLGKLLSKHGLDISAQNSLRQTIEDTRPLYNKSWLLEKLA